MNSGVRGGGLRVGRLEQAYMEGIRPVMDEHLHRHQCSNKPRERKKRKRLGYEAYSREKVERAVGIVSSELSKVS